jgi:hypothetical protein
MSVALHDFVVNRPQGEDMANARGLLYLCVVKLKRVVVVVTRERPDVRMAATHMTFRLGRARLHTCYRGWAGGVDGNGRSAAIGKSGRWRAKGQLLMW